MDEFGSGLDTGEKRIGKLEYKSKKNHSELSIEKMKKKNINLI